MHPASIMTPLEMYGGRPLKDRVVQKCPFWLVVTPFILVVRVQLCGGPDHIADILSHSATVHVEKISIPFYLMFVDVSELTFHVNLVFCLSPRCTLLHYKLSFDVLSTSCHHQVLLWLESFCSRDGFVSIQTM